MLRTPGEMPLTMNLDLATLFEMSRDALLLAELDSLQILGNNQAADLLFGRSPNELADMKLNALLPGLSLDRSEPQTVHGRKTDGQTLVLEVRLRLLPAGPDGQRFLLVSLFDMTDQVREERILGWQHRTIYGLLNHEVFRGEDLDAILRVITEEATRALEVERASVWIYQEQETQIRCLDLFVRAADDHSSGIELAAEHYPAYFEALREDRVIAAHDAHQDRRTHEFSRDYLTPLGIGAMVDAPIHLGGKTIGVICLEHVGGPRRWLREEQNLVASLADMVSLAFEQSERKRAEAALRKSARLLGMVVSNAPVILFALDKEGFLTLIEGRGLAKFGIISEQAVGRSVFDMGLPWIRENCQRALGGETFTANGQVGDTSFDIWYAPHLDAEGAVTGVIGVATDVTERRLIEERLKKSRQLLKEAQRLANLGSWEVVLDPPSSDWSDELYRILGVEPGQVEPSFETLLDFVHPDDRERLATDQRSTLPGDLISGEYRIVRPDGEVRTVLIQGHFISDGDGRPKKVFGTIQDITERKLFEEQRMQNDSLKRSNALKDQFLSIVSHELRTPLTAIKGAASLLSSGKAGPVTDKQAKFLGIISNHSVRLSDLINDVLDLSKMEAGKMTYYLAEGNLALLAREVCDGFVQVFEEKGISLVLKTLPAWSRFDSDKMVQVLSNLLSNASKFAKEGGCVVVRVEERDGMAVLEVEDDGIGIPEDRQAQLFSKFYQVDSSESRKVGGTGLGLAICKTIVEDGHGGAIGCESQVGRGTTFTISLPLAKPLDRPAKVLLIDDEAELNRDLAEMLQEKGIETQLSSNGYEGIASAIRTPPDLIVLDLLMPGMDGYEVLDRLKAERSLKQLPIWVHTVDASPEARERALAGGAEEVFVKWQTSAETIVEEVLGRLADCRIGEESL